MNIDVLVAGAHPDDAELGAGGTLALLAARGKATAILDLTRGELGTRGTPEERAAEAQNCARVLGVARRMQAGLPDGYLGSSPQQRATVIKILRTLRPKVLIVPKAPDRHPDHAAAQDLLLDANFQAGLTKLNDGLEPHRAETVLFYHAYADQETMPTFVQDISETFETKLAALRCYTSQFHNPEYSGVDTFVSTPAFWDGITARAAYWGGRIGAKYGEPFYARAPLALDIGKNWL
jgi:bacillithiol biosynthesis deacetylase BshB1